VLVGVAVAVGLAGLRRRIASDGARHAVTAIVLATIVVGAALDVRTYRPTAVAAEVPPAFDVLANDPQPSAVEEYRDHASGVTASASPLARAAMTSPHTRA
jgi:hypothetical protein